MTKPFVQAIEVPVSQHLTTYQQWSFHDRTNDVIANPSISDGLTQCSVDRSQRGTRGK